jgi:hypothetical protein
VVLFVAQLVFHVDVPIGLTGLVASLLGLDLLADALTGLRVGGGK